MAWQGKPHSEQDKIGASGWPVPHDARVCRIDKWLPPCFEKVQNPAYTCSFHAMTILKSNRINIFFITKNDVPINKSLSEKSAHLKQLNRCR